MTTKKLHPSTTYMSSIYTQDLHVYSCTYYHPKNSPTRGHTSGNLGAYLQLHPGRRKYRHFTESPAQEHTKYILMPPLSCAYLHSKGSPARGHTSRTPGAHLELHNCTCVYPKGSPAHAHISLQTLQVPTFSCITARIFIPRAALLVGILQALQVPTLSCITARVFIPRAALLMRILQTLQVPKSSCVFSCTRIHPKGSPAHAHTSSNPGAHLQLRICTCIHPKGSDAHVHTSSTPGAHLQLHTCTCLHSKGSPAHVHTSDTPGAHL